MTSPDPGSFRDPASRVVLDGDDVIRLLDERGLEAWRALSTSKFFAAAVADGRVIDAAEITNAPLGSAGALRHPRLPFISYPFEWTFSMLKDAALLQLGLLEAALDAGITIKDSTPYNIQFHNGKPVFIDIGSFEAYRPGEPWIGYRQFTRQFLFPLMMRAWLDIPFQPWLRGDLDGLTPRQMANLLPFRKRFNTGALLHVVLQARMEDRMSGQAVREDLKQAGFNSDLILANVRKLKSLVGSLEWKPDTQGWSDYHACAHVGRDRDAKSDFLTAALNRADPHRVLDLGANDGHFSRIAVAHGADVVALDSDEAVLDDLYRQGVGRGLSIALTDLGNPSPAMGWAGKERPGVIERCRPEMVVAYGVIHHLIYGSSIPPQKVLEWLRSLDCPVALEFVSPGDEMVARLVGNKLPEELHSGIEERDFRALMSQHFEVRSEHRLESGTRVLFDLDPR